LLVRELESRRAAGERVARQDYHARFPGDTATLDSAFQAVFKETESDTRDWPMHITEDSASADANPPRLGRYIDLGEIGGGGMGVVHRVQDLDLNRDLALKVMRPREAQDAAKRRRFVEEAQVTSQLQHPGVPPIFERGQLADGRPYYAMKLVRGQTLGDLLKARGDAYQDLPQSLATFEAIAQTIAYAHSKRVIHRDLKPANIMVGGFGEVQVMDWGLAKVLGRPGPSPVPSGHEAGHVRTIRTDDASSGSRAGAVMGTFAYMPPEQALGQVDQLGERTDVFALGSILCTILTGRPAYVGSSAHELHLKASRADLADAFARLDASGADAELIALAKTCLAPEPANRPANAGVVASRVAAYQAAVQERLRAAELARVAAETRAVE
jgi:serine/threonine-protein kinase